MFIFLLYFLLNIQLSFSSVVIQNAGIYEIKSDDIAMIFFLTIENTFECKVHVSVCSLKCIEGDPFSDTADHMYVIGGDMGIITGKSVQNVTLIYPNLYLRNRVGKCLITVNYQTEQTSEQIIKEVYFNTNKVYAKEQNEESKKCSTCDLNSASSCNPVDCVIKYSSKRSYFNKEQKICDPVPECPTNTMYVPKSNICRKLHEPVCESDLEMIEDGYVEQCHTISNLVNFKCYHGQRDNVTGVCVCDEGWATATCAEGAYHPTLNLYHMCNVEFNSWERANREKLIMTILVLVILAIALAAKMLLAVCLLNWCCHFIRKRSRDNSDNEFCGAEHCQYEFCGDDQCLIELPSDEKSSKTIKVSVSNMEGLESGDESDVTVSVEDDDKTNSKSNGTGKSRATINICTCDN